MGRNTAFKNSLKMCYWNVGGINTHNRPKVDDTLFFT